MEYKHIYKKDNKIYNAHQNIECVSGEVSQSKFILIMWFLIQQ